MCLNSSDGCCLHHALLIHLCSYVVSSLEMLVAEDYLIIYMNGATPRSKMPGISWLKKCYQMIDRRWDKRDDAQKMLLNYCFVHALFSCKG